MSRVLPVNTKIIFFGNADVTALTPPHPPKLRPVIREAVTRESTKENKHNRSGLQTSSFKALCLKVTEAEVKLGCLSTLSFYKQFLSVAFFFFFPSYCFSAFWEKSSWYHSRPGRGTSIFFECNFEKCAI